MSVTRGLQIEDAPALAAVMAANRQFPAPWCLATEALREAAGVAFGGLRLHRMQAETLVHDERSHRVLRRVGFTGYGTAPSYLHIDGRWQDHVLFQLLTPAPDRVVTA